MPAIAGMPPTGVWTIILLIYAFFASTLAVTTLLQPRDFINSHQLMIAMVLLVLGVLVSAFTGKLEIVAPAMQTTPAEAPPMWPFLFITIACGAISGFHALVSSGTSAKQVANEKDSLFVGYGSMILEGVLATLVIVAVAAGIGIGYTPKDGATLTGVAAWTAHYSSWGAAAGLGSKVTAFVVGSANMMNAFGLPMAWAVAIMGVFVASFAGTTLDTATRIQRYVVTELFSDLKIDVFKNRYVATAVAVITAGILAFATGASGAGALTLWPLFGALNQTLAALALLVITMYLKTQGGMKWVISGLPAIFMLVMTFWGTILNEINFIRGGKTLLVVINSLVILIVIAIAIEGLRKFFVIGKEPVGEAA
jgi:carbon starvation protein